MNDSITAVPGIEVGNWTDHEAGTGCTVVVLPEPNVIHAEVRGAAPGTREYALAQQGMRVEQAQAILLTGGSAFGLAAADGVVAGLEEDGRGHETPAGRVPIVPSAVIFDLLPGDPSVRPGPPEGLAAYRAAGPGVVSNGRVGAGTGATVAKWRGFDGMQPGGIGSARRGAGQATVGALVVLNAVGDVFQLDGTPLTGGPHEPEAPELPPRAWNTTLIVAATDATLDRRGLSRLAVRAHDALAACVRPAHTRWDGDIAFTVSCGGLPADEDALGEAVFGAVAAAIARAAGSTGA